VYPLYRNAWVSRAMASGIANATTPKEGIVATDDKVRNKAQEMKGKAKEAVGRATDNEEWEAEGKADQAKGNLKQAGEKVKDIFK
jgi:uncharacterized protein YjbJ (UPF0337 family)